MKRSRMFEDSAPFPLVIKQSVQEITSSEQQPFHWGPRFDIGCRGLGRIQPLEPRNKVRRESPEVTTALWKVEQESRCFGTVSETRRTQHGETKFGHQALPAKCLLPGEILSNLRAAMERKGQNTSVRINTVQGPS